MNCKDFESMIHELVSRRMADKTRQLQALEHAGHCLWCALRLDEESKLTARLNAFASTLQGQRAPVRVEEALVQAFRERGLWATTPFFGFAGKRLWRGLSWGLLFAASLATAWLVIFQGPRLHPRRMASPPQGADHQAMASAGVSQAKPEQAMALEQRERQVKPQSEGVKSHLAAQQTGEGTVLDQSGGEVATDFIPFGTCDVSQCMDEATLVRVTLPSEALLAFGLATDDDSAMEGFVRADVALGSDGVPFAIRFVN